MRTLLISVTLFASGCASTLSTLQTAETTPARHLELKAGLGGYAPTASVPHIARAAKLEAQNAETLATTGSHPAIAQQERDELVNAALALALQTPGPVWELDARFGLTDFWDIGARYSSNDWALDSKLRLFKHSLNKDLTHAAAIDVRYASVDVSNPVVDALDFVNMGDFSRWDLEVTGLYTLNARDTFKLYGGPKFVRTQFHFDDKAFKFGNDASAYVGLPPVAGAIDDQMFFYGGVGGFAASYKRVTGYVELNAGWTHLAPNVLGSRRDLSGLTFYPAIGVAVGL